MHTKTNANQCLFPELRPHTNNNIQEYNVRRVFFSVFKSIYAGLSRD